jgi:hypothetical protein
MGWLSQASADLKDEVERRCDLITAREARALCGVGDPAGGFFGILSDRLDMHPGRMSERALVPDACGRRRKAGGLA